MEMNAYAGISIILFWLLLFVWVGLACKNINPLNEIKAFLKKQSTSGRIVFLLLFLVMTIYGGTKPTDGSSTNDVNNVSESINISADASLGQLHTGQIDDDDKFENISSLEQTSSSSITSSFASIPDDFSNTQKSLGYVLVGIITNELHNFSITANGAAFEDWLTYGASDDMFVYEQNNPIATYGTNLYQSARVYSQGSIGFSTNLMINVFNTILGIPPTNNWQGLEEPMLWCENNQRNSVFSWHDVLLNRINNENISFKVEITNDGDIISHYDNRVTEYIKNLTNFTYSISISSNTTEEIAINNTCSITNHTCATLYESSPNGGIVASHLCEIIQSLNSGLSLLWKNISDLKQNDDDNDGLSNFEEICIYKTNYLYADTDGDCLNDAYELYNGYSPIDADEDNDGIPDGANPNEWSAHPLWSKDNTPSVVISLNTPIPSGVSASLMLNDLTIPLSETNSWGITLPPGELVNIRLQSTGHDPIDLHLSQHIHTTRNYDSSNVWVYDPSGIFEGKAISNAKAKLAIPRIRFYDEEINAYVTSICIHDIDVEHKDLKIVLSPKEFADSMNLDNLTLENLTLIGNDKVRISLAEEEEYTFGFARCDWFSNYFEYNYVSEYVNIHICTIIHQDDYCIFCSEKCSSYDGINIDINGDYNRTGIIVDNANEDSAVLFSNPKGMVIPVNNNDTNQDGIPDCDDDVINGVEDFNELNKIKIESLNIPSYLAKYCEAKLVIHTEASDFDFSKLVKDKIRIFDGVTLDSTPYIFEKINEDMYETSLSAETIKKLCNDDLELLVEGRWHGSQINIVFAVYLDGVLSGTDIISILNAPFFVLSNCDQTKKLFMGYYSDWSEVYNSITNSSFLNIPFEITGHPYLQDYAEFGASIDSNGEYYPVIMDFNSNNFNDEISPNTGFFSLAIGGEGGNIEGLPVSEQHPYGRVIVGSTLKNRQPQIYKFLKNQKIQGELIELDTDWLQVGHVDEIISIVPTANSYKIFVFDTQLAIDIFATNVNNSIIFYPEILEQTYSSYTNLQNQALVNFMTNRTAEIFTTLSNNNIETMQIVSVPVLFSLGVQSASDQESHSKCILFNPLNSVYLNVNGENKAILSVGLYAPYCSYYFDLLVTLGYNNGNILPINTISMQKGGGSIHCATNIKRER